MTFSQLFSLSSILVIPFWFAMIVLPLWSMTRRVIASPFISAGAAVLYLALVLPRLGVVLPAISGGKLTDVAVLLGSPAGATIAWVHFLAFDLFIGRWAYLESRERGIHALIMAPVLLCIFMVGPIGFLLYLGVRAITALRPAPRLAVTPSSPLG